MRFVTITICLLFAAAHIVAGQSTAITKKGDDCSNWFEKVYPFPNVPEAKATANTDDSADMAAEVKEMMSNKPSDPDNASVLTEHQAISAMACLLQLYRREMPKKMLQDGWSGSFPLWRAAPEQSPRETSYCDKSPFLDRFCSGSVFCCTIRAQPPIAFQTN